MADGPDMQSICALQCRIKVFLTLQGLYNKIFDHPAKVRDL